MADVELAIISMAIKLILNNQAQSLTDLNPTPTASESEPSEAGFEVSLGDRVYADVTVLRARPTHTWHRHHVCGRFISLVL